MRKKNFYSKKDKRKLSEFFAKELIYDFMASELDENREKHIREDFTDNVEVKDEQRKIQKALKYCNELSSVTVSEHLNDYILTKESYLEAIIQKIKFHEWPIGVKVGLETLMVVGVLVLILIGTPWDKIAKKNFISNAPILITEVSRTKMTEQESENKNLDVAQSEPLYKDEVTPEAVVTQSEKESKSQQPALGEKSNAEKSETKTSAIAVLPKSTTTNSESMIKAQEEARASNDNKTTGGFLYRGQLSVANLKMTRLKLNALITELGGRKAGEVELGWLKTQNQAYYHFTIPEAKYEELITFLSGFGKPQLKKERHPRIMPDGINRIIFVVDEKSK